MVEPLRPPRIVWVKFHSNLTDSIKMPGFCVATGDIQSTEPDIKIGQDFEWVCYRDCAPWAELDKKGNIVFSR